MSFGGGGGGLMKRLHIQLQPARSPGLDADAVASVLQALAPAVVTRGEDEGPYINIDFRPTDVGVLWAAVRERVRADPALAASAIVCCEGKRGWDDYRLLHHFDPAEPLDEVADAEPGAAADGGG
jgi:hypothetical protein